LVPYTNPASDRGVAASIKEEKSMSKRLVQRTTNMAFSVVPDGTVAIESPYTGESGAFKRGGPSLFGDLAYADQVMLDYPAGSDGGPGRAGRLTRRAAGRSLSRVDGAV
jgi:hypothetical protein